MAATSKFKGDFHFVNYDTSSRKASSNRHEIFSHVQSKYQRWKRQERVRQSRASAQGLQTETICKAVSPPINVISTWILQLICLYLSSRHPHPSPERTICLMLFSRLQIERFLLAPRRVSPDLYARLDIHLSLLASLYPTLGPALYRRHSQAS
jgi:hypothetical protein